MTVQRIDHRCACHLSLFFSSSHTPSFSEQSRWGVCIRLRFVAARAACQGPHLCPVSFLLLKVRSPLLCLIAATDTTVPAMRSFLKSAFLRTMLTTIVKIDRNEKYCTYVIDHSFAKLTCDIKLKLPTSQDAKCTGSACLASSYYSIFTTIIGVHT